jgi:tRNA dimethylallyltransferase
VALIAGPTASGKSGLAVALAHRLGADKAVVINADASQVYTDLALLSARPSDTEMEGVPHHLFGHIDGAENYNVARWASDARAAIASAHAAHRIPILVGGTGLYLRSLLHGIAPVPPIDPDVRAAVRALPTAKAHAALADADPAAALRLHPADSSRVARALEVVQSTGRTLGDWQTDRVGGIINDIALAPALLLPPRDWLRDRCDQRLIQMFDQGAIAEVETLAARKLPPDLPVMRAIGVPQILRYLSGDCDRETALELAQAATRQYAKRQYTWFRHQPPDDWIRHELVLSNENLVKYATILHNTLLTR